MKKAYVFFATGFEDIEALAVVDILRRAEVEVKTVSILQDKTVVSAHGVPVTCDVCFDEVDFSSADALVLPGGLPGAQFLNDYQPLRALLVEKAGTSCYIAAICAAPMVLGGLELLKDKEATCYPGFEPKLLGAKTRDALVVHDGQFVTGRGPGAAFEFGYQLVELLVSREVSMTLRQGMIVKA
jgi:4-methyl-5(b-hydroxyethyl)-thiazole monophosphate biosynthesis